LSSPRGLAPNESIGARGPISQRFDARAFSIVVRLSCRKNAINVSAEGVSLADHGLPVNVVHPMWCIRWRYRRRLR